MVSAHVHHHALHRGHHLAGPFRHRVFQHLAAEADRLQVVIITDTRVRKLADLYTADMPGLTLVNDTRRDIFRRHIYELRREPAAQLPG